MEIQKLNDLRKQYAVSQTSIPSDLTPRKGYYKIKSFYFETMGHWNNVPAAEAIWSPALEFPFSGLPVKIQLVSLFSTQAIAPFYENEQELLKGIIEIKYVRTVEIEDVLNLTRTYVVAWELIRGAMIETDQGMIQANY